MKPEKKFYNWLKTQLPGHWQGLEALNAPGLPDVNVCYRGVEVWLELKSVYDSPSIRPMQYAWGIKRSSQGGKVFVINECENDLYIWRYPFEVIPRGKYVTPYKLENIIKRTNISLLCSLLFDNPRL